jgi:hypothetical protein
VNRRAFLTRASVAVVGACAATKIPTAWLPAPVRRYAALEFLTRVYNDAAKGRGHIHAPKDLYVGSDLFQAIESELMVIERHVDKPLIAIPPALKFKGATVWRSSTPGWYVMVPLPDGGELRREAEWRRNAG